MKIKNIVRVLLVAIILASCAPATTSIPSEEIVSITSTPKLEVTVTTTIPPEMTIPVTSTPKSDVSATLAISPTDTPTPTPVPSLASFPDIPAPDSELAIHAIEEFASAMQQDSKIVELTYQKEKGRDGIPFVVGVTQDGYPLIMAKQIENDWIWKEASLREIADSLQFLVGTNLRTPFKAREIPESIAKQSQAIAGSEFNLAILDEYTFWFYTEYKRDQHDFDPFAKDLAIAASYKMAARGYHILYGCNEFQWTDWLKNGDFDNATLSTIIDNHTRAFVGKFKGKINGWVVTNEVNRADGCDQYYNIIGPDYVTIAFRAARETDPNAYLMYCFADFDANKPADAFTLSMVKNLNDQGLIDSLDLQFHLIGDNQGFDKRKIVASLREYAELGVPIDVGELSIRIRNVSGTDYERYVKQAALYRTVIEAIFESGVVRSIAFWEAAYGDQYNWLDRDATKLGVDNDWNSTRNDPTLYTVNEKGEIVPKPALYEVRKVFLEHLLSQ
jgi:endo-1,4-beta-xylanase